MISSEGAKPERNASVPTFYCLQIKQAARTSKRRRKGRKITALGRSEQILIPSEENLLFFCNAECFCSLLSVCVCVCVVQRSLQQPLQWL